MISALNYENSSNGPQRIHVYVAVVRCSQLKIKQILIDKSCKIQISVLRSFK
jgi:hypothetical protein